MIARNMNKVTSYLSYLFRTSGLDQFSFETLTDPGRPDRIEIVYRNPVTDKRMRTPDGRIFRRILLLKPEIGKNGKKIRYLSPKNGGNHLYFPTCFKGNLIDHLAEHPDEPIYVTEGEKKAAKACLEGIPCIATPGIWSWVANKNDRPNGEKILHPDFDLIPNLERRGVIMVYDSDANDPDKKDKFDRCSEAFEKCLRARGVNRYEKIVLPSEGSRKVGLDDYLINHSVADFDRLVAEQSRTVDLHKFIMPAQEFLSTKFPPIKLILQPWLEDCGVTMIHSAPGTGKTLFLLAMCVAITRKKLPDDFCGWKIKLGAGVLYIDAEMPAPHMQKRLAKLEAAYSNNPESKKNKLWLLSGAQLSRLTGKTLNLSDEYWRELLFKIMADHPAKVIILDNIVSLTSMKDENDASAWSVINHWLLRLRAMGKSVIFVHHSGKKNQQRGTSHRMDNIDQALRLKARGDEGFTVHFEKKREFGGIEAAPVEIHIEFDNDKIFFSRQESDKTEQKDRNQEIGKLYKSGKPQKEIAKHFGLTPGSISQIIKKMKKEIKNEDE